MSQDDLLKEDILKVLSNQLKKDNVIEDVKVKKSNNKNYGGSINNNNLKKKKISELKKIISDVKKNVSKNEKKNFNTSKLSKNDLINLILKNKNKFSIDDKNFKPLRQNLISDYDIKRLPTLKDFEDRKPKRKFRKQIEEKPKKQSKIEDFHIMPDGSKMKGKIHIEESKPKEQEKKKEEKKEEKKEVKKKQKNLEDYLDMGLKFTKKVNKIKDRYEGAKSLYDRYNKNDEKEEKKTKEEKEHRDKYKLEKAEDDEEIGNFDGDLNMDDVYNMFDDFGELPQEPKEKKKEEKKKEKKQYYKPRPPKKFFEKKYIKQLKQNEDEMEDQINILQDSNELEQLNKEVNLYRHLNDKQPKQKKSPPQIIPRRPKNNPFISSDNRDINEIEDINAQRTKRNEAIISNMLFDNSETIDETARSKNTLKHGSGMYGGNISNVVNDFKRTSELVNKEYENIVNSSMSKSQKQQQILNIQQQYMEYINKFIDEHHEKFSSEDQQLIVKISDFTNESFQLAKNLAQDGQPNQQSNFSQDSNETDRIIKKLLVVPEHLRVYTDMRNFKEAKENKFTDEMFKKFVTNLKKNGLSEREAIKDFNIIKYAVKKNIEGGYYGTDGTDISDPKAWVDTVENIGIGVLDALSTIGKYTIPFMSLL
jgi:hypothetical protein